MIVTVLGKGTNGDMETHTMATAAMMTVTRCGSRKTHDSRMVLRTAMKMSTAQMNSGTSSRTASAKKTMM